ncbi:MAG: acylphosphatase, partial [Candidatus Methanoperedens sp.]|nr:acylphosphatase [Candidatus Methanoperedens sp.]
QYLNMSRHYIVFYMTASTHSITIRGKVQDIGFRNTIEHIGRAFGLPGMVFNAKDAGNKGTGNGERR